jgi:hypothetical protein
MQERSYYGSYPVSGDCFVWGDFEVLVSATRDRVRYFMKLIILVKVWRYVRMLKKQGT